LKSGTPNLTILFHITTGQPEG